jgi:hypothetical protein
MSIKIALPWIAGLLLQMLLAAVLATKRIWRKFPFFSLYCALNLSLGAGLYVIHSLARFRPLYFGTYCIEEGVTLLLGIGVVYEIFSHLLTPYSALRKLAIQLFISSVVVLAAIACAVVYAQPSAERHPLVFAFLVAEEAARILELGLLVFLFSFASAFGLHWRQYAFGISLGLGVFVAVELVALSMRLQFGVTANSIFNIVRTFSFNASLLIWISYMLAPELATAPAEMPKRAQLEQWNRAVMELIYQ